MDADSEAKLEALQSEAISCCREGNFDKAIEIHKGILARYNDHAQACERAYASLGDIYLTLRELDLAEDYLRQAMSYSPMNPKYHYLLGFTYSVSRQWNKAIREFELSVKQNPHDPEYLRGLGWAMRKAGKQTKGLNYLHQALALAPDSANILTDLAVAYLSKYDFNRAVEYAKHAVRIAPENALAQEVLDKVRYFQKESERLAKTSVKAQVRQKPNSNILKIYQFKVTLKETPGIWRIIEIKGNQMLSSLHKAIFNAFDRFDEHLYSFFMSNKPYDKDSEYTLPDPDEYRWETDATRIRIDTLHLQQGQKFLYLFDYGDQWWHEVEVVEIREGVPEGKYPRVVKRKTKSPPQYASE
jgi:tetratricopeptide (TPR) repeat protein